jgi:chromosome segregation ATPase
MDALITCHHPRLENELRASEAQIASLSESAADARVETEASASERKQLMEMNEDLSNQVSEHLHSIMRLQDRELELTKRIEMIGEQLEKEKSGVSAQMQFHWEAEDEVSSKDWKRYGPCPLALNSARSIQPLNRCVATCDTLFDSTCD